MGRWDRRHLWRLTQFLHKNWRALSDEEVGNKLAVLSLWWVKLLILLVFCWAVLCSKVKAGRFPLPPLYHLVTKFSYKLPTLSAWANVRPENKSALHPRLLQKGLLLQITKASWKKSTDRESFSSMRCWAAVACFTQSSLLWRSARSNLSGLSTGLCLVRVCARAWCGNTKGLVDCKPESDNQIVSQVLSMLKKIAQP